LFQTLTVSEQLVLISCSSGLIGVHGQALALLIFLPSATRRTALLELLPRGRSAHHEYAYIFPSLCRVQNVQHIAVTTLLAPGCAAADGLATVQRDPARLRSPLKCNVTVPLTAVDSALNIVITWIDAGAA